MPATSPTPVPPLRRLPVPDCQPPYDDEPAWRSSRAAPQTLQSGQSGQAVQGTLALAFVLPNGVPATPVAPRGLRLVPDPADTDTDEFGPRPTARAELPDPRTWAARLVQAVVEVLSGDRPRAQLLRWTVSEVYESLGTLAARSDAPAGPTTTRALVRSVHVSEPDDGVAEVAALVRRGARTRALALRLEGLDGRWQCTALEIG